jgi:hypothetical protein
MIRASRIQLSFGRITVKLLRRPVLEENTLEVTVNVAMVLRSGEPLIDPECMRLQTKSD